MKFNAPGVVALQILLFSASGIGSAQDISLASSSLATPSKNDDSIKVRMESYPRPPYSSATYYIYEKRNSTICTKIKVCDKFDACESKYVAGEFKAPEDVVTGKPYHQTTAVFIRKESLAKHMCLTKFSLLKQ